MFMIMAIETTNPAKKSCHGMVSFFISSLLFFFYLWISFIPDAESSLIPIKSLLLSTNTTQLMNYALHY
jgi:hypothetical protein